MVTNVALFQSADDTPPSPTLTLLFERFEEQPPIMRWIWRADRLAETYSRPINPKQSRNKAKETITPPSPRAWGIWGGGGGTQNCPLMPLRQYWRSNYRFALICTATFFSPSNFLEVAAFSSPFIEQLGALISLPEESRQYDTCAPIGHVHHVAIRLRSKYFINLKWKMERPIGTYLRVIQRDVYAQYDWSQRFY